jgi:hypothetical protein
VGSLNEMEVKSVGSSGGACFGRGKHESGVSETMSDIDC